MSEDFFIFAAGILCCKAWNSCTKAWNYCTKAYNIKSVRGKKKIILDKNKKELWQTTF